MLPPPAITPIKEFRKEYTPLTSLIKGGYSVARHKPAAIPGRVMASGISRNSRSINDTTIRAFEKNHKIKNFIVRPNPKKNRTHTTPERTSTIRYLGGILP